jgi:hypothetical protein
MKDKQKKIRLKHIILYLWKTKTKITNFFKNERQEGKTVPVCRLVPVGEVEMVKEAECSGNIMYSCRKMEK